MKKIFLYCSLFIIVTSLVGNDAEIHRFPVPKRKEGQKNVLELRAAPIKNIRVAFIGAGNRGGNAIRRFAHFPNNVTIKVICDLYQPKLDVLDKYLKSLKYPHKVEYFTDKNAWKKICERDDIDFVYVTTGAGLHTPIAVHAMKNGKHVATEVPSANLIKQCWELVDTAEQTQKHCMILENCNFNEYTLAVMNMQQKGLFGEVVHVEGGYFHDLRDYRFNYKDKTNWRKELGHDKPILNGNPYPTHGIGPIAHWLNIHRGDRFSVLNSISSSDFALRDAAGRKFGENDPITKRYFMSDINISFIKTVKGKTVVLYYSTALPGPYSLGYKLYGTRGFTQAYPERNFTFDPKSHTILNEKETKALMAKYRHPITEQFQKLAQKYGGHGGMDTIMDMRIIYCLNNGLPLDVDVYDSAEWSSIIEASRISVHNNGKPVEIPDFTRGDWKKLSKVKYYMAPKGDKNTIELIPSESNISLDELYAKVDNSHITLTDSKTDGKNSLINFVGGRIFIKNNFLEVHYTSASDIPKDKLSYHFKLLISTGVKGGYDRKGVKFLVENGTIYKFVGEKPFQWKWQKIANVKTAFQKQYCEIKIPLNLISSEPNRIGLRMYCQEDYMPNKNLPPVFLTYGNLARGAKVVVTTSATRDKYSTKALNDGQVSDSLPWDKAAWASTEDEEDKFIQFKFPTSKKLKKVIIYWEEASQEVLVQYKNNNKWITASTIKPMADDAISEVVLPDNLPATSEIRLMQKLNQGSPYRPNLLWVKEVEIY